MTETLNETLHCADQENVSKLINDSIEKFKKKLASTILYEGPFEPKQEKQYMFRLYNDLKSPCEWLGDNCYITFNAILDCNASPDKIVAGATFGVAKHKNKDNEDESKNIEYDAEINTIEGKPILNNIEFGVYFVVNPYICEDNNAYINNVTNEIKSALRHEFDHAYKELFKQTIVSKKDGIILDKPDFKKGYDQVAYMLRRKMNNRKNKGIDERDQEEILLSLLYKLNYIERSAYVAGFNQDVYNDVLKGDIKKDIKKYSNYKAYYDCLDDMKKFNDITLFRRYMDNIHKLFGDEIKTLKELKEKLSSKLNDVLRKMESTYAYYLMNESYFKDTPPIKECVKAYNMRRCQRHEKILENANTDDRIVMNIFCKYYMVNDEDHYIRGINNFCYGSIWPFNDMN